MLRSDDVERAVAAEGFDLCGITRAVHLSVGESRFLSWIEGGYGDDLGYLHRNQELRFDASKLIEGGRSVVVCGVNYKSTYSMSDAAEGGVGIASYALMRDYHKSIRNRLKRVLKALQAQYPETLGRVFVDSAPLLEKSLAVNAGLGWIGRQSLLVTKQYGSFVLLGEIVIDQAVDRYNEATMESGCGECRRCVDSCPVGAINEDRTIDARRCISCRTIECDDVGVEPLHGWIFGCDECQRCCPYNQRTPYFTNPDMRPIITPPTKEAWEAMSSEARDKMIQGTPLRRRFSR